MIAGLCMAIGGLVVGFWVLTLGSVAVSCVAETLKRETDND